MLAPFHRLHDRRYTVYLDVYSQEEWAEREAELLAEQERQRQLDALTVDLLLKGEQTASWIRCNSRAYMP